MLLITLYLDTSLTLGKVFMRHLVEYSLTSIIKLLLYCKISDTIWISCWQNDELFGYVELLRRNNFGNREEEEASHSSVFVHHYCVYCIISFHEH